MHVLLSLPDCSGKKTCALSTRPPDAHKSDSFTTLFSSLSVYVTALVCYGCSPTNSSTLTEDTQSISHDNRSRTDLRHCRLHRTQLLLFFAWIMPLSFSSFLPEDFVTTMRDISWNVFGDEEVLLFFIILGLPGVILIAFIAFRIRSNYHRVRFAEGAPRRPEEYHSSSDSSESSDSGEDERDFMSLDEMLAATYGLAARTPATRAVTSHAEQDEEEEEAPSDEMENQVSDHDEHAVSESKKKN